MPRAAKARRPVPAHCHCHRNRGARRPRRQRRRSRDGAKGISCVASCVLETVEVRRIATYRETRAKEGHPRRAREESAGDPAGGLLGRGPIRRVATLGGFPSRPVFGPCVVRAPSFVWFCKDGVYSRLPGNGCYPKLTWLKPA